MNTIGRVIGGWLLGALVALVMSVEPAHADFHTVVSPSWFDAVGTTSQVWAPMTSSATVPTADAPQVPTSSAANPNGVASWYDASAADDGAFVIGALGGDVYSFASVITPTATVPGSNVAGNALNVFIEAQSYGGLIDPTDLTASYTDGSGPHSLLVSSLPSYEYTSVYNDGGTPFGGFGTAYTIDHEWTFTLPSDVAALQLTWGWDASSSAIQDLAIFTQSAAVASASAWTGAAGTQNWGDAGNWSGGIPGATSGNASAASALFDSYNAANPAPPIDAGRNLQNITFDNATGHLTGSLTLGTADGNPLLLSGGGTIRTTLTVAQPQAVDAPLMLEGDYTFTTAAADAAATLDFSGAVTPGATGGTTTLTLAGSNSGANSIAGILSDNGGGRLAIAKSDAGTWVLAGANTFSGGLSVAGGTLRAAAAGSLGSGNVTIDAADAVAATLDVAADQNVAGLSGTVAGSGRATLVIEAGATFTANQANDTNFAGTLIDSGILAKSGSGALEFDAAPTWKDRSALQVAAGRLRFAVDSGTASVGSGVTATIAAGATLELAGTVSALSSGSSRANIVNDSQAADGGLLISGSHQEVGGIDGAGNLVIEAGSDLTANHVVQNALIIGGTADDPAMLIVAPSTATGQPLFDSGAESLDKLVLAPLASIASSIPDTASEPATIDAAVPIADLPNLLAASSSAAARAVGREAATVPEPATFWLAMLAIAIVLARGGLRSLPRKPALPGLETNSRFGPSSLFEPRMSGNFRRNEKRR